MYTAGTALIEALREAGVSFIFANLGSDHPAIVESLAEASATGRPAPKLIICPNEMVALSAAHGFAQITGRAQAVLVHVECGTQALAGALHNAAKGRVPVLILAGASPFTQEGEMRGSRNEFIQWIQDVFDQRGLVRGYVKYDNEIRTGRNIKQMIFRAQRSEGPCLPHGRAGGVGGRGSAGRRESRKLGSGRALRPAVFRRRGGCRRLVESQAAVGRHVLPRAESGRRY